MADLINRSSCFNTLKTTLTKLRALDEATVTSHDVTTYINSIEKIWDRLEKAHEKVLHITDQAALQTQFDAYEPMYETHHNIMTILNRLKSEKGASTTPRPTNIKLPDIALPHFNGRYEDWPTFSDLFTSSIHNNSSLSGSIKLQYLKSCIKGDAANIIKSFTITDANYTEAWSLLEQQYDNKREIISSHVKKLFYQPLIKHESASALQEMLNTTLESIRSLKVLGQPTDKWDGFLTVILVDKFDGETKAEWARSLSGTSPPTFKELQDFLIRHIRTLHAKGTVSAKQPVSNVSAHKGVGGVKKINTHHTSVQNPCQHCKGAHQLFQCTSLKDMTPEKRYEIVKSLNLCLNCLRDGHSYKKCRSTTKCRRCSKPHHTLIHFEQSSPQSSANQQNSSNNQNVNINTSSLVTHSARILKTAIVDVFDCSNVKRQVRVFIDEGAEASLINESTMRRLGLQRQRTEVTVTGVCGTTASKSRWMTTLRLHSQISDTFVDVELYAVPKISDTINRLPHHHKLTWSHIKDLRLADQFYYKGGEIDILIGVDIAPYIIKSSIRRADRNSPVAQDTIFGWVLTGNVMNQPSSSSIKINNVGVGELADTLRKFWEIEELPSQQSLTQEEEACEQHFLATHQRLSGRYVVRLPFNEKKQMLGESREQAVKRLLSLERRFQRQPQYKTAYVDFMREYEQLGHMEKMEVSAAATEKNKVSALNQSNKFYLPHHFVLKEDSTTTKQRTVFDGSAKTSTGISLNDTLMVGATVQPDLFTLLLRFRCKPIALKADIAKMYRQFMVHEDDRDFQRILFRENPTDPIQEYRLTTVTYGTASAPFAATRCLNQLAEDEKKSYPAASQSLLNETYVDDLLSSVSSEEEAIDVIQQLIAITKTAGMEIRKWCSNSPAVLRSIPEHLLDVSADTSFSDADCIKALGIRWQPASDTFTFSAIVTQVTPTKRNILSEIAKTFDPLGWLAPVTVNAKLLLQKVWLGGHNWDETVSADLQSEWANYQQDIGEVGKVSIPRCVTSGKPVTVELHGFCDSSELAYASCVYLKCTYSNGNVSAHLLTARTKVAPLKCVSLPKLELCGAKLLADTIDTVTKSINHQFPEKQLYCWSDSTIALRWISSHSRKWKTFVANRVASIQSIVPPEHWHHVRSGDNPADLPSRGIQLSQLTTSSLWWHGPSFLHADTYPIIPFTYNEEEAKKEERTKQLAVFHLSPCSSHTTLFNAFSSLKKLCRVGAYLIRFILYLKSKVPSTSDTFSDVGVPVGPLTLDEINVAKMRLIKWAQSVAFPEDILHLEKFKCVVGKSKLIKFTPYLDSSNIMRVGGRLQNADIPEETRHPIIITHDHPLTHLIIHDAHLATLHGGFTLTYSTLQQQYWILRGRDTVRHLIRKCIICRKLKCKATTQLMGNLPAGRVQSSRPFKHVGVDFAGPFSIKMKRGRHVPVEKAYLAIFVCLATKAVHLEAVTSLSSEAFVACYERFVSRRGVGGHLYSDCGTNFVGADKMLKEFLKTEQQRLQQQFVNKGTQWHFNPPSSPHQGGLWEAGVKSVKYHFYRVVGQQILNLEQFMTLLCKIEACLNSRPLCAISSDTSDLEALTPGHFLIGSALNAIPEPDISNINSNRLGQWELVRQMTQHFWKRWSNEYLTSLQQRFKWTQKRENIKVGDLVVVADDQLPATKWKMGRILETFPGSDGLVRSVSVKTANGIYKRPVTKLSPLISEQSG